ncbi:MAG: hypothetical protein K6E35_03895, partial [Bacteroidales bacterium]|nr:hypothetical protein [Bacteroidales bacterium]
YRDRQPLASAQASRAAALRSIKGISSFLTIKNGLVKLRRKGIKKINKFAFCLIIFCLYVQF